MPKTKGTKRGAEAAADASAKKGRRASEADVALRLGDELGEHTIVSLANIILLKIAADLGCGDTIDHMAVVKNYLCLFVALLFIAKTFTENLITGTHASSKSSPSSKGSEDEDDSDDEDAARAAAPRPPSADFFCALHDLASILLTPVQHLELNVFELLETHEGFVLDVAIHRLRKEVVELVAAKLADALSFPIGTGGIVYFASSLGSVAS